MNKKKETTYYYAIIQCTNSTIILIDRYRLYHRCLADDVRYAHAKRGKATGLYRAKYMYNIPV